MRVAAAARALAVAAARFARRSAATTAPHAGAATFTVPVRCHVTVNAHGATAVDMTRGAAHDAVAARWWGAPVACAQEGGAVNITVPADVDRVEVAIPGRYCGVSARTRGGAFTLAALAEAALAVDTGGGAIILHSARCTAATVASGGGAVEVTADLSAETVALATAGGPARLVRLTAVQATLATQGGDLAVGALYSDRAVARTAGGSLTITQASCRLGLDAATDGGDATLASIDGVARLDTGGGRADVRLSPGIVAVAVTTRGGDAQVRLAPELTENGRASVIEGGAGGVMLLGAPGAARSSATSAVDAALASLDAPTASGHSPPAPAGMALPTDLEGGDEGRRGGGGRLRDHGRPPPVALVDATPGGSVTLQQASWIEGALGRAAAAAAARRGGRDEG